MSRWLSFIYFSLKLGCLGYPSLWLRILSDIEAGKESRGQEEGRDGGMPAACRADFGAVPVRIHQRNPKASGASHAVDGGLGCRLQGQSEKRESVQEEGGRGWEEVGS